MKKSRLTDYASKRDFEQTPEPQGKLHEFSKNPQFVIHKHAARSLHYDLRLEDEGVLKSWAIPKGPSTDPHEKHLAIKTENHPLEYGTFEGTIPEGNYGAGGVIIWDKGTFKNLKEASLAQCIKDGAVTVQLDGKKLKGAYALIKVHLRGADSWLFFKMNDNEVDSLHSITKDHPESVVSGKTVEEFENKVSKK